MLKKKAFESALSRVLKRKGLKNVKDLMALDKTSGVYFLLLSAFHAQSNF